MNFSHPHTQNHNHNLNHNHMANVVVPQATSAFSIPIKICDGLFMADHYIAQDTQFFQTNLITHVINCAGQQVQNNQKISGVAFLTFDWSQNMIQNITEQKVISVTVNFIEECRKQAGCMLINYANSQSRPFCLLACYFMVRFKWSLFKTLEFLNSRKEDVELQPAFFQQLTAFAQKLQDKGLIRSKTWNVSQGMSDQEIIITNTYLNSKNKFGNGNPHTKSQNRNKNKYSVSWKKDLVIQYTYCPNSAIQQKNIKQQKQNLINEKIQKSQRKSLIQAPKTHEKKSQKTQNNSRQKREDSSKKTQNNSQTQPQLQPHKTNIIQAQQKQREKSASISSSMTEINVTKKWAQLRQMWLREKQNHNGTNSNLNSNKGVAEAANSCHSQKRCPKSQ